MKLIYPHGTKWRVYATKDKRTVYVGIAETKDDAISLQQGYMMEHGLSNPKIGRPMKRIEDIIDHGIASLRSLQNNSDVVDEINDLPNINVSDMKRSNGCGHCASGRSCNDSCDVWYISGDKEIMTKSYIIYFTIDADSDGATEITDITATDRDFEDVRINESDVRQAIIDKLAY